MFIRISERLNSLIYLVQTSIFKALLRRQNLKILDNNVKYTITGYFFFGTAEFDFELIMTLTFVNKGPQEARMKNLQNYLTLPQVHAYIIDNIVFGVAEFASEFIITASSTNNGPQI